MPILQADARALAQSLLAQMGVAGGSRVRVDDVSGGSPHFVVSLPIVFKDLTAPL